MEGTEPHQSVLSSNREAEVQTKPMAFARLWSRMVSESRKLPKLQRLNSARRAVSCGCPGPSELRVGRQRAGRFTRARPSSLFCLWADSCQDCPCPCAIHEQIHPSAALILTLSPLWLPTASMWQASAQADSFQQMVAGVNKGMGIQHWDPWLDTAMLLLMPRENGCHGCRASNSQSQGTKACYGPSLSTGPWAL